MTLTRALARALLCAIALAAAWPAAAEQTAIAWRHAPGSRQTEMPDPIFQGKAMVYEWGRGNKKSVILLHGLTQDGARQWYGLANALKNQYHVVGVDLPGFGYSEKGNKLYTPDNYAAFLKQVVRKFTKGPVTMIGHSLGGTLALRYAAQYPEDVDRLLVVDAIGMLHRSVYMGFLARAGLSWVNNVYPTRDGRYDNLEQWVRDSMGWLDAEPVNTETLLASEEVRAKLLQGDPAKIAALALVLENFGETIRDVRTPTLVIWGQADMTSPLRVGKLLASRLANARLEVLPGSGHNPMLDNAEVFNGLVQRELKRSSAQFRSVTREERYALPLQVMASKDRERRTAVCKKQSGVEFTGDYKEITIENCSKVVIRNARIGELVIEGSEVTVENSHVRGLGLRIEDSSLMFTGGSIYGVQAVQTESSEMDFAGVDLSGQEYAVEADSDSLIFFSVSRVDSPFGKAWVHGIKTFRDSEHY